MTQTPTTLLEDITAGDQRALARAISIIEDRRDGYRDLVSTLHHESTGAHVIGVTGSPGSGKSTLVDRLTAHYRERDETVGIIAIDPSSPYSGGAVLGDRIRMGAAVGDDGIFVRSMSTRGSLGGLSTATADAVKVLDAAGKDRIIIETVGAGQNEVDVVKTADSVLVLVPPQSGDSVQMLKAGILEIAHLFVVNKADLAGADRIVRDLRELIELAPSSTGDEEGGWTPEIVETVASQGEGITELATAIDDHLTFLDESGLRAEQERRRYAEEIRTLVRDELGRIAEEAFDRHGGLEALAEDVRTRETDPYSVAAEILEPLTE